MDLSPGTVTEPWNVRAGRIVWVLDIVDDIIFYRNCFAAVARSITEHSEQRRSHRRNNPPQTGSRSQPSKSHQPSKPQSNESATSAPHSTVHRRTSHQHHSQHPR